MKKRYLCKVTKHADQVKVGIPKKLAQNSFLADHVYVIVERLSESSLLIRKIREGEPR